jgi:hypothetical protein
MGTAGKRPTASSTNPRHQKCKVPLPLQSASKNAPAQRGVGGEGKLGRHSERGPTDAEVDNLLSRLGLNGDEYKPYSYNEFRKRQLTEGDLRMAKKSGEVRAEKGFKRGNLYLVRDVVRHWYRRFDYHGNGVESVH